MDERMSNVCGWRGDLEADVSGEFWVDREALTEAMSRLTVRAGDVPLGNR